MEACTTDSWKLSLPCTRAEAVALAALDEPFPDMSDPPVAMASEPDPAQPDVWRLDLYCASEPDAALIARARRLAPSARSQPPRIERLAAADWLTLSQAGIEPIRAGRFFVHTAAHADAVPPDAIAFHIEAGRAFGTGQHETTTGCLLMLDAMKRQGARFHDIIDLGTGTGLLAFAALALWPRARAIASDIDPVSIEVTAENAAANKVRLGGGRGQLGLAVAPGMTHPLLQMAAPYDLVVANILAAPLIALASSIASAIAPGGSLILAGLLDQQADAVTAAYRRRGMRLTDRIDRGDWPTLRLRKRRSFTRGG